jgi:hypothetical protein
MRQEIERTSNEIKESFNELHISLSQDLDGIDARNKMMNNEQSLNFKKIHEITEMKFEALNQLRDE